MSKPVKAPKLNDRFWTMGDIAYQRMTVAEWRAMLLENGDTMIRRGRLRKLVGKNIGAGVIEVRLEPLHD